MKTEKPIEQYPYARVIAVLIMALILCAEDVARTQGRESISVNRLRHHMDSIASDVTEGRFTGSLGYEKAAHYAAGVFRSAGLDPGWPDDAGQRSFFQPVPFVQSNYDASSICIRKKGKDSTFMHTTGHFIILSSGRHNVNMKAAPPAYLGYGIHEPERGWDDYAGADVDGRWVIIQNGVPPGDTEPAFPDSLRKIYSNWKTHDSLKMQALHRHHAKGLIVLPDKHAADNWEKCVLHNYRFNYMQYAESGTDHESASDTALPIILVDQDLAHALFDGQAYDPLKKKGVRHSFVFDKTAVQIKLDCEIKAFDCRNVVALVPGTHAARRNEYIIVGAHLDHLGKMGDQVYNGANDDASGCAIILEAAGAIASNPLKRSVLFVLFTSEEQNLAGSGHFLKVLPVPAEQISMYVNIEQIGSKNRDFAGIWAIGDTAFKEAFYHADKDLTNTELKFSPVEEFSNALEGNVDLWNFYQKDIPVIMLSSGGFPEHHTIRDKIGLIDFEHLDKAARLLFAFIRQTGNE